MGGACSTQWREDKRLQNFSRKPLNKRGHLEDLYIDGRRTLKFSLIKDAGWKDLNWIHLAQDRDKWRELVNTN
jgi:hypothetical protein